MRRHSRIIAARAALLIWVLGSLAWLARLDYTSRISLDVLDLLPADGRSEELRMARRLAGDQLSKVVLLALDFPDTTQSSLRMEAGDAFLERLRDSGLFAEVYRHGDAAARDDLVRHLLNNRFTLLLPGWLEERRGEYQDTQGGLPWEAWLAEKVAEDLEAFLGSAAALAFEDVLPLDPLLLLPSLAEQVPGMAEPLLAGAGYQPLFWAQLADSPFEPGVQAALAAQVASAEKSAARWVDGATVRWTGVVRFAAFNRETIKGEVTRLNLLSVIAVFAASMLCLRRARQALHAVPVVLLSLLGAWAVTTMLVPRVHIVVLVVGALLCGIAVDFSFHFLLHRETEGAGFAGRLQGLLRPLLVGAFTSAAGFSSLLLSELPFIRHLGLFVTAGLAGALLGTILWFAQWDTAAGDPRPVAAEIFDRLRSILRRRDGGLRAAGWFAAALLMALVAFGLHRVRWYDDVREMEVAAPHLYRIDREVRAEFGEEGGSASYFTSGATFAEAREAQQLFVEWVDRTRSEATRLSLASLLPLPRHYAELERDAPRLAGFPAALRRALEANGFDSGHFEPFFEEFGSFLSRSRFPAYEEIAGDLVHALHGPLAAMLRAGDEQCWIVTVIDRPLNESPPLETATMAASQVRALNHVFGEYRKSAARYALTGVSVAACAILIFYGWRAGAGIVLLPAVSGLCTVGLLGAFGGSLNLFHLLGVFLGSCLCFDYAAFAVESGRRGKPPPPSILLSALTTAASFGVLATSAIPVVAALGATVLIMVTTALLVLNMRAQPRRQA